MQIIRDVKKRISEITVPELLVVFGIAIPVTAILYPKSSPDLILLSIVVGAWIAVFGVYLHVEKIRSR